MKEALSRCLLLLILVVPLAAAAAPVPSQYLFVWAMEAKQPDASLPASMLSSMSGHMSPDLTAWRQHFGLGRDFLAVFDIRPGAAFAQLVTMLPVGAAVMAHHTNYVEPPDDILYANDWLANHTYVFDLRDARHPRLLRDFGSIGAYGYPHSFVHLANGNTLATFQYSGGYNHAPGGLVEFDPSGRVVRSAAAQTPEDPNVRPYSVTVVESLDRVITSSADMMAAQVSHVVQVWRLSDLKLIRTIVLPPQERHADSPANSSEPRLLADGKTVVVPTFNCGLFVVRDLASDNPTLQHVYDFGYRTGEVPVIAGDFMVESMQSGHAIVSLSLRDPEHPREVSRILLAPDEYPHWLGLEPGGDRMAVTGYGKLQTRLRFATLDRHTGALRLEAASIDFTRAWPDGWQGSAVPHGVVFSNP